MFKTNYETPPPPTNTVHFDVCNISLGYFHSGHFWTTNLRKALGGLFDDMVVTPKTKH